MLAWEKFLKVQEKEMGKETVSKWLRPLRIISYDACNLYLEVKDSFQLSWFEEHVRKKVLTDLVNNNARPIKVHLVTPQLSSREKIKGKGEKTPYKSLTFDELDPYCTFENTILSANHLLVYKLLFKIANYDPISAKIIPLENHLVAFNPIYLFGGEGTGKSHFLMATAHALRSQGLKVIYVRAETFTEHIVNAMRAGSMDIFRHAYRTADVLLIDDVQLFYKKAATQEELFHTFNALHLAGKQMMFSSTLPPAELQHIELRLVSRFEWGIVLPLQPLSSEDRGKLLKKKMEAMDIKLHPKIYDYLLLAFPDGTRPLTQAMETLVLRHYMKQKQQKRVSALTLETAKHLLKDLLEKRKKHALTPEKIIETVSKYFGKGFKEIVGKKQSRDVVFPRHIAMFFCRQKLNISYPNLGRLFHRDHSTVMSAVNQIRKGIEQNDNQILIPFRNIKKKLYE